MEKKIEKKQDELLKIDLITNHSEIAFKKINSNSFQDTIVIVACADTGKDLKTNRHNHARALTTVRSSQHARAINK